MKFQLVVLKPFAGFGRGDVINDVATMNKIMSGPQASFVVRVLVKEG